MAAPGAAAAEEVLRAIMAFPDTVDFTKSFLRFADKVNRAGRGVVRIQVIGGPEAIPRTEQPDAVRRGIVDMHYGPASYYLGLVPEGDALVGSNLSPMETRANGGLDLLRAIYREKLNVYVLGHFDGGVGFHIYLRIPPGRNAAGGIDLSAVTMRSQPIYREFFRALGARTISVPVGDAFTALERGIVDGTGWVQINLSTFGWDKFLRYRVDPPFFQSELLAIVNHDRWDNLSVAARELLERTAIEYESESYRYFQELIAREDQRQRDGGMTVITLEGAARRAYLARAYGHPWSRLRDRDPAHVDELRSKFHVE